MQNILPTGLECLGLALFTDGRQEDTQRKTAQILSQLAAGEAEIKEEIIRTKEVKNLLFVLSVSPSEDKSKAYGGDCHSFDGLDINWK